MGVTIKGSASVLIRAIKANAKPTLADALYVGERQRARILDRTGRGVDIDGRGFAGYSTKLFYYSPDRRLKGSTRSKLGDKKRQSAVKRLFTKIGGGSQVGKSGAPYVSRSGLSICFPGGYRQFKKWLGRSNVDLRGKSAPHMLQGVQIQTKETGAAVEARIGIYGPKAKIANAHNAGGGRMPKRKFFGASKADRAEAVKDLKLRIKERLK